MRACIGLLAFCSCTTPQVPDVVDGQLNSLGLQISALQTRQSELDEKIESLEDICILNRDNLSKLQKAITPQKRIKKK